jgi:hypothetical protein
MNSHNTKPAFDYHKTPVLTEEVKLETKTASRNLAKEAELSIADDVDASCDPYNSTGQHVILQAKLRRKDPE